MRLGEIIFKVSGEFIPQILLGLVLRVGLVTISNFGDALHTKGDKKAAAWTSVVRAVHPVCVNLRCPLVATYGVGMHHSAVRLRDRVVD